MDSLLAGSEHRRVRLPSRLQAISLLQLFLPSPLPTIMATPFCRCRAQGGLLGAAGAERAVTMLEPRKRWGENQLRPSFFCAFNITKPGRILVLLMSS
eukprot:1141358-Pelagomonas_calceolata.AAC.9